MERTHFVYRAFDEADRLLYVGCTGNATQRYAGHRSTSDWFPYAVRFEMSGPYTKEVALKNEKQEIRIRQPLFNALPEHARMVRRVNSRRQEIQVELLEQAGYSERQLNEALDAGDYSLIQVLKPIFTAANALAVNEVGLRCTNRGRLRNYLSLIGRPGGEEVA